MDNQMDRLYHVRKHALTIVPWAEYPSPLRLQNSALKYRIKYDGAFLVGLRCCPCKKVPSVISIYCRFIMALVVRFSIPVRASTME